MALDLAREVDADIVLATDPDADRLGVYAKDSKTGEYMAFTGNMSGMLIAEYILDQKKAKGQRSQYCSTRGKEWKEVAYNSHVMSSSRNIIAQGTMQIPKLMSKCTNSDLRSGIFFGP